MEDIIEVKDVTKRFFRQKLFTLRGVSLDIHKDEFLCFLGSSGCGKTTLVRIIAGLEKPTSGKVIYKDKILKKVNPEISMVFQSPALMPWLTVKENINFGLNMRGGANWMEGHKVEGYLTTFNLTQCADHYPKELSGGMRQRVAIARALAENPDVLILDEPFSQVDQLTAEELKKDILNAWEDKGRTVVMIPRLISDAVELADRVVIFGEGEIKEIVPINLSRPRQKESPEFLALVSKVEQIMGLKEQRIS